VSHLRKALDDLRLQNDENIKTISHRNDQIAVLQRDLIDLKRRVEDREKLIEDLRGQIQDVDCKNRQLNDKINEILYNKATMYKEKTLEALKKSNENCSPNSRRERVGKYGP